MQALLKRITSTVFRDETGPFTHQPADWQPPEGTIVIDVTADPGTPIAELISAGSMRTSLKTAAAQAKLNREMTALLLNVGGAALRERLDSDLPKLEGAAEAIWKKDPGARIEVHVEVTSESSRTVLVVFALAQPEI
jgi:hypothetical protein